MPCHVCTTLHYTVLCLVMRVRDYGMSRFRCSSHAYICIGPWCYYIVCLKDCIRHVVGRICRAVSFMPHWPGHIRKAYTICYGTTHDGMPWPAESASTSAAVGTQLCTQCNACTILYHATDQDSQLQQIQSSGEAEANE